MVFLLRLLLLELAFASDRKDSVLDCHFYVFLFHVRQLGFNYVFLVIFGNVGERFPISNGDILSSVRGAAPEDRESRFSTSANSIGSQRVSVLIIASSSFPARRWVIRPRPVRHLPGAQQAFHSQFWADNVGVPGNLGDLFSNHVSHFARIRTSMESWS